MATQRGSSKAKTRAKKTTRGKPRPASFPFELLTRTSVIVLFLILAMAFLGKYVVGRSYISISKPHSVDFEVFSPQYLEMNSEETLYITVQNKGKNTIHAIFGIAGDNSCHLIINHVGTDQFFDGMIPQNQLMEGNVNILVPLDLSILNKPAGLSLWGSLDNQLVEPISGLPVMVAPVPLHRHIFWGTFSVLAGLTVWAWKKLWDHRADVIKNKL